MTTPSSARQAAEAWAQTHATLPFEATDAFLAGAAWMNEQCAKEAEQLYDKTYWDDPSAGIVARIRALMPEQDGTREGK